MASALAAEILALEGRERYQRLRDWWRRVRHPRIAELALAVARDGAGDRDAVGGVRKADHESWLALAHAGDPFDLPRLLASLLTTNSVVGLTRLRALDTVDDPHLVPGMFAVLRKPPSRNHGGKPLWRYMIERLARHPEIRIRFELDEYLPQLSTYMDSATGDWLRRQLQQLELPDAVPALTSDDERALAALEAVIAVPRRPVVTATTRRTAAELLAQIYAEPDDDSVREVYADVVGGAVGEFIVAQLRDPDVQPSPEVANQLLGPLTGICSRATFVRGFPEEVVIWKQRPTTIRPAIGLPGWMLVRAIDIAHAGWEWPEDTERAAVKLLNDPVMRRLSSITNVPLATLPRLTGMPSAARLAKLGIVTNASGGEHALAAFTSVTELSLAAWRVHPFAIPHEVLARLDVLVLNSYQRTWWAALDASPLRVLQLDENGALLRFTRTATGLDELTITTTRANAIVRLDGLPTSALRTVTVRNTFPILQEPIVAQLLAFPEAQVRWEPPR